MSNYTPAMEQRIRDAAPLNLAKAKALAEEFASVSHRSVISKAQSMGVEYVKAAPAAQRLSRHYEGGISFRHPRSARAC